MPANISADVKRKPKGNGKLEITPSMVGLPIYNASGGTLAVGDLVYVSGWDATRFRFKVSKADADVAGAYAMLIIRTAITNNQSGWGFYTFLSPSTLNTNGSAVGDPVYLSTTAGGWTLTAPVAPARQQVVGRVTVVSATVGQVAFDLFTNAKPSSATVDVPAGTIDPAAMGLAVWNDSGGAMAANDLVYISGYNAANDKPTIAKADSDAAGKRAQYVCIGAIANGAAGRVYKTFTSAADQNTAAAGAAGDPVYLSTTAGGYVIAAPAAGVRKQIVGHVKVKDAAVGVVVFNLESCNDELFGTTEMAAGLLAATAGGRALMATGVFDVATALDKFAVDSLANAFLIQAIANGAFAADDTTRALFAAGFLGATATGRGLVADDFFTSAEVSASGAGGKFAAGAITAAGVAHLFAANAIDKTGADAAVKTKAIGQDKLYVKEPFAQYPKLSKTDGYSAPTGATGDVNLCVTEFNSFEYHVKGAGQTILGPVFSSTGFDVAQDLTADEGAEYTLGITSRSKAAFTVGTSGAFYAKCKFTIADVSGTDDCAFGFRKAEAYQAAIDDYDEMAVLNVIAGDIKIETILNNAATTTTDTTDNWTDGQSHTLEVYVSAAGVVTYKIDGAAPTATAAYTFDNGEVVVPFFYFLHDAVAPGAITLESWEVGLQ